jgi:preprotein translocase subunit SecG
MLGILVVLHGAICVLLLLAVLIQQGKGASMGMLGGASQSWFGPSGAKTVLMKITVGLAVGFLMTSMLITLVNAQRPASPMAQSQGQPPAGDQTPR